MKQLVLSPISPDTLQFGEASSFKRYGRIFAIDTNTKGTDTTTISASCFSECRFARRGGEDVVEYTVLGAFAFQDGPVPECENFGWHVLIESIKVSPDYDSKEQFAIITDSNLGKHGAYNDRSEPYFAEHFLPNNFTLLYATDQGRYLGNKVIKICDHEASTLLKEIEEGEIGRSNALSIQNGWCSEFRGWYNSNIDFLKAGWFRLGSLPLRALVRTAES